jgi:hypothetical protein
MMPLKISKLDAARRQIETAVVLYFNERDPVSIHTLTAAAYNVLLSLGDGEVPMMKNSLKNHVKEGKIKNAIALINKAENFFKHADRDPDDILDFDPKYTEFLLWECCSAYRKLTNDNPDKMISYNIWFKANNHDLFIYTPEEEENVEKVNASLLTANRRQFFRALQQALNTINE